MIFLIANVYLNLDKPSNLAKNKNKIKRDQEMEIILIIENLFL